MPEAAVFGGSTGSVGEIVVIGAGQTVRWYEHRNGSGRFGGRGSVKRRTEMEYARLQRIDRAGGARRGDGALIGSRLGPCSFEVSYAST